MASTANASANATETRALLHGMVKWFDQRKGFGFITVVDGSEEYHNKDIFVHHTDVVVQKARYKNLFQGEYVSFYLTETGEEAHPVKAVEVMGAFRGLLRADTRIVAGGGVRRSRPQGRVGGHRGRGGHPRGGRGRQGGRQGRRDTEAPIDLTPANEDDGDFEVEQE